MKNTILVSAATAFVTTCLVLFTVAMVKGHGCKGHCGGGHGSSGVHANPHCSKGGGDSYHGSCHKKKKNGCKSMCSPHHGGEENIEIEKKVIIKTSEEEE